MRLQTLFALSPLLASNIAARDYCTYGESCWPSTTEWTAFNSSVSGRLIAVRPPAAVCHGDSYDQTACSIAQANWTSGPWRADQPGASQETNWENGDARCFISAPKEDPCEQGLVPVLAVAAETVDDIQKAAKPAAKKNLYVVVKNTGHDYLGRSSGANSFSIWTHKLKGIEFSDAFTPAKCHRGYPSVPAVTVGAGDHWVDVYRAAHEHKVVVVGGAARTVGAAGGYVLGGGHSPLGHLYGMAVDNVLQFTLVTADGKHVTANACTNTDLFWALRGGGGSAWGVITTVTHKTHPPVQSILSGGFAFESSDTQTVADFTKLFFEFVPQLIDAGFRGYTSHTHNATSMFFFQANSSDQVGNYTRGNALVAPLYEWVAAHPTGGAVIRGSWTIYNSFFELFDPNIGDVSVGTNVWVGSRIISRDVFLTKSAELLEVAKALAQFGALSLNIIGGGAIDNVKVGDTPLHPAWRRQGLASYTLGSGWPVGADPAITNFIKAGITNLSQTLDTFIGDNPGSYFNEADPLEPKWKEVFWGPNYDRLLRIKKKVDPKGVFTCNRCVGSDL